MSNRKGTNSLVSAAGAHSLAEILSQPQFWSGCITELEHSASMTSLRQHFGSAAEWLFIGCGSSYYIGLTAAATFSAITGKRARAIPASELLLFPDIVLAGSQEIAAVVISRSGRTSETLKAAQFLERDKDVRTLAITSTVGQPLEQTASSTLPLLPSEEESTVMTRSFTSMVLGLQYVAAFLADDQTFSKSLSALPALADTALAALQPRIAEFLSARQFADYVCLGQGPFYGLACETALKITEMSASYAQSFHTLEFRHGPKAIVSPETLVIFLLSERGYDAECDVLEEVKSLGGTTVTLTNQADERARAASDLLIEFGFELPELARMAPYVFAGQLIGLYTGLKKGLDPDNPRHLSRVVILNP